MESAIVTQWIFVKEVPIDADLPNVLIDQEELYAAFRTTRDTALFTNKRLIVHDTQGLGGTISQVYSLPFSSIIMWNTRDAGDEIDINSRIELWTHGGYIKIKLGPEIDVKRVDQLLASAVLR